MLLRNIPVITTNTSDHESVVNLALGFNSVSLPLKWKLTKSPSSYISIPKNLVETLGLPKVEQVNLLVNDNDQIRIGPYIGLLIAEDKLERQLDGDVDYTYEKFLKYISDLGGMLIVFSYNGIHLEEKQVSGFHISTVGQKMIWRKGNYALPRVIYDRSFGDEGRIEGPKLRCQLLNYPEIKIFNNFVKLGKVETYQTLSAVPSIKEFIPHFREYSLSGLKEMLLSSPIVYVKPDDLAKGEGVTKIVRRPQDYLIEQHTGSGEMQLITSNLEDVTQYLKTSQYTYVMQNGIDLATCFGNIFDIRIMLQKNKQNQWEITGSLGRIAHDKVIVTGPRSGGRVLPLNLILSFAFSGQVLLQKEIIKNISHFSLEAGKILEEEYGLLGELGVDLGVDHSGKLWLIEINGKPLKVSMTRMRDAIINSKIYRYPILFACYLDDF